MGALAFFLGWLVGVGVATLLAGSVAGWLAGGVIALALAGVARQTQARLALVMAAGLCLGSARYQAASAPVDAGHIATYNDGPSVAVRGMVKAPPQLFDRYARVTLAVAAAAPTAEASESQAAHGLLLVHVPRFAGVRYGDWLTVTGRVQTPESSPGFDYAAYLARRQIYSEMRYGQIEAAAGPPPHLLYAGLYRVREQADITIRHLLPDPEAALLRGILLGDDRGIPDSLDEAFRITGTAHIIAISGFNIALLAGMLLRLGTPLFGPQRSVWLALPVVGLYTVLVGADAAVVRAALMAGIYLLTGRGLGRNVYHFVPLLLAAFIMTLMQPTVLWDVSFQLSFAATSGLVLFVAPLSRLLRDWLERWVSSKHAELILALTGEGLLVTLAAQVLTLPLLLYHFQQISLISLPANLLVLWAQPGVMSWGGLAALGGMAWQPLGQLLAVPAWLFLSYTIGVVSWLANVPFAAVRLSLTGQGVVACYLVIGLVSWLAVRQPVSVLNTVRREAPRLALIGALALALVVWQWAQLRPDGYLHVTFLDVGQGDAVLIQTPGGRTALVDGGNFPSRLNTHLGHRLPYTRRHLDLVVATHPDDDHITGLPELFTRYRVTHLLMGRGDARAGAAEAALLAAATEQETIITIAQGGQAIRLDEGVWLDVLHPDGDPSANGYSDNDSSIVLRLRYGAFSLLLTGDAEVEAERALVASGQSLQALVLKAGHHGAATSGNDFFLEAVQPQIMVISVGADNRFGHPHPDLLARANAAGSIVLRTDELGTIEVISDGRQVWWLAGR